MGFPSVKAAWFSPPTPPKLHSPLLGVTAVASFKPQRQSSSAGPFLTPSTISYTCQHSWILPALLGCHSKSGQVWPHGMEPIFSKLSCRCCNQGELLPSYILGGSHSHPPGSKLGHSYLTYLWNQLKVIDMLNDHTRGKLHSCCYTKQLWIALLYVSRPQLRFVGVRTSYIYFSNISQTPWVLDPITNPFLGPSSWLHPASRAPPRWMMTTCCMVYLRLTPWPAWVMS